MKRLALALTALAGLAVATGAAAQSYPPPAGYPDANGYATYSGGDVFHDYARVVRVDPVLASGYGSGYGSGQRCYESVTPGGYAGDPGYYGGSGGYYGNGGYYSGDGGYDGPSRGTQTGRNLATIAGGVVGAVLGSKVGGGSGQVAAAAVGSMLGGMAGRQIYEQSQEQRYPRTGTVRVCDPVPASGRYGDGYATAYDVTYEYHGHRFTRRMSYNPGDRVRVRVDVTPD